MTVKRVLFGLSFLLAVMLMEVGAQVMDAQLWNLSDAPNDTLVRALTAPGNTPISYQTALREWKSPLEMANWMKDNFQYDMDRAKLLSENSAKKGKEPIRSPGELYRMKRGVCIDLSRFGVETLSAIDSSKHPQYLLIEFEPIIIDGSVLRKHWVAVYDDTSAGYFIFADSKRPGAIEGPYADIEEFISAYELFRNRKIVSWKTLPSYQKMGRNMKSEKVYN